MFVALLSIKVEGDEIISATTCNQTAWILIGVTLSSGTRILKETRVLGQEFLKREKEVGLHV